MECSQSKANNTAAAAEAEGLVTRAAILITDIISLTCNTARVMI